LAWSQAPALPSWEPGDLRGHGRIAELSEGRIPIFEPGLDEIVEHNTMAKRLSFTSDVPTATRESLVIS
jgi:UDPglucose 6-dehydrogenase